MNEQETKYCKDCKYVNRHIDMWCEHPVIAPTSLVDARPKPVKCSMQRFTTPNCMYYETEEIETFFNECKSLLNWLKSKLQYKQ